MLEAFLCRNHGTHVAGRKRRPDDADNQPGAHFLVTEMGLVGGRAGGNGEDLMDEWQDANGYAITPNKTLYMEGQLISKDSGNH